MITWEMYHDSGNAKQTVLIAAAKITAAATQEVVAETQEVSCWKHK